MGMDHRVLLNTSRLRSKQQRAVVARKTVVRIMVSLDFTFSVSPFSIGKGLIGPIFFKSLGLITGVLHKGHFVKASSNLTPQFTQ
jgi:hypothetical protein